MRKKFIYLLLSIALVSCSSLMKQGQNSEAKKMEAAESMKDAQGKEFARGEVILATELLVKIFDKEMAPLDCVPDTDEASLLLRTIRPRMEIVEDDMGALLDQKEEVKNLINTCDQNCTCVYVDDLLREHLVPLSKDERTLLTKKRNKKEISRCLNYARETFCQSELYKALSIEKEDFSFDEESP